MQIYFAYSTDLNLTYQFKFNISVYMYILFFLASGKNCANFTDWKKILPYN